MIVPANSRLDGSNLRQRLARRSAESALAFQQVAASSEQREGDFQQLKTMMVLLREASNVAYYGMPDISYVRSLNRMRVSGLSIGDKYNSSGFVDQVERLFTQGIHIMSRDKNNLSYGRIGHTL